MTVADNRLYTTRWVHVFEEDTPEGAVYRPEDDNIPLSRRPRERLELSADGTAKVITQGPDDRLVEKPATWSSETRESAKAKGAKPRRGAEAAAPADPTASSADFRIVKESPSRLIVRRGAKS
jgi:hypothetical protein